MKYAGMPMGMWALFAGSFQKQLTAVLGYNDLRDPSVSGFFRFLARVGDHGMKMQIVKIGFGGQG